jgi:hypothetical protein
MTAFHDHLPRRRNQPFTDTPIFVGHDSSMTGDRAEQSFVEIRTARQGRGRFVQRASLSELCDFDVWLPSALPSDLTNARYTVFDFSDRPNGSYAAHFQAGTERWLRITSGPGLPHSGESTRVTWEAGRLYARVRRGEAVVTINSSGLSEDEFELAALSLQRLT